MHKKSVTGGKPLFQNTNLIDEVASRVQTPGERVQEIPLEKVKVRDNVRKDYQKIDELAESIRQKGLLQPITVTPAEDGGFEIIFGHRRYKALCLLKEQMPDNYLKIQAIVKNKDEFDADEVREIQLIENIQREELTPLELKQALQFLRVTGLSAKRIAEKLGKSEGYIRHLFSTVHTLDSNPQLAAAVERDVNITLADVHEVKSLPKEEQTALIEKKSAGAIGSTRELREAVARRKSGQPTPLFSEQNGVLRFRSFQYNPERITTEEKIQLLETLRTVLARIEATITTGESHQTAGGSR
jgi:ParB family chromosome partitioning protein